MKLKTLFTSLLVAGAACAATVPTPPNILIILSDDQGYDDLSSHGNKFAETPRLDRLAAQSLEFTRFYVEPACAPTRASLLTGRSFVRTGVWSVHFGGDYLALDETTFADRLRDAGYATGCFGKWHNGKSPGYLPADRGFQHVKIADLYTHQNNAYRISNAPKILGDTIPYKKQIKPGYAADRLADDAIEFLRENRSGPFCLYLPHIAVHSPWEAPPELMAKYQKKGCSPRLAALYGLLEQMDRAIGRVLDELDRLGLAENTVVFFLSDNGAVHNTIGTHAGTLDAAEIRSRNVSNLRGTKGTIYEGGIRSPLLVRWPGKISPGKTDVVAHVTDLFPTFLDLGSASGVPKAKPLDGKSLKPLLLGQVAGLPPRAVFGSELNIPAPNRAGRSPIRTGLDLSADRAGVSYATARLYARDQRFKLIKRGTKCELFDMAVDPEETTDVREKFPAEARRLDTQLHTWFTEILKNERPYQAPVYLIGRPGAPGAVIHLNGAHRLTGDFAGNGEWAHSLSASASGSTATFAVRVLAPGRYRAVLEASVKSPGCRGMLSCGAAQTGAPLAAGAVHELGTIDVPASASDLVFTLTKTEADAPGVPHFWNLVLLRAESPKE